MAESKKLIISCNHDEITIILIIHIYSEHCFKVKIYRWKKFIIRRNELRKTARHINDTEILHLNQWLKNQEEEILHSLIYPLIHYYSCTTNE